MNYVIAAMVAVFAAAISYISLEKSMSDKIRLFQVADPDATYHSRTIAKREVVLLVTVLTVVAFFSALQIMIKVKSVNGIMKMILALLCMMGAACFDYREYRIPNIFPLVMAGGAAVLLLTALFSGMSGAMAYITTGVVAAIGCAIVLVVASALTKQGIGAGDIKLISALALLTGVYCIIGTLFFGVVACSLYAIVALVMKKKKTSSSVPFGPFLLFGYITTLFAISF